MSRTRIVPTVRRSARLDRALALAPRVLAVAFLAVTSLLGVRLIVAPADGDPVPAPIVADPALEEYAEGFARAYLSWDAARPEGRERALARYEPGELDAGAGFVSPEHGRQRVVWTRIAQNQEALAGGRIVVVAVGVDDGSVVYLAVPVIRDSHGALALAGYPALVGPPVSAEAALERREEVEDPRLVAVVERALANYLAGERENLEADLAAGAQVSLPADPVRVEEVQEVAWADPESSAALATVRALDEAGASLTLTYEIGVERSQGRVVVSFIETLANET